MIKNAIASVAVKDLESATGWYEKILGRAPDSRPMPEVVEWEFPGGGWLQVYEGPDRAGGGSFTLAVDDFERAVSDLKAAGVDVGDQGGGEGARTVMVRDPDGNSIAFAHSADPTMAG